MQYKLLTGDFILIFISIILSYMIKVYLDKGYIDLDIILQRFHWLNILFFLIYPLNLYIMGFYSPYLNTKSISTFYKLFIAASSAGIITAAIFFFFPKFLIGRTLLILQLFFSFILFYLWRLYVINRTNNKKKKTVLGIIGRKDIINNFLDSTKKNPYEKYVFKILYLDHIEKQTNLKNTHIDIEVYDDINILLSNSDFDAIAIDSGEFIENDIIEAIYNYRFKFGKSIYELAKLYESLTGKVPINNINKRWFLSNPLFQAAPRQIILNLKRIFDFTFASILFLLTLPIMLFVSILIKIESRGPVFYVQERLGLNKKPFQCYKFRTMIHNAEKNIGPVSSEKNDPRLTRIGKFLRKTRFDELPQLYNILNGDISFVGPRPIRKFFSDKFKKEIPFYDLRYNVKPGLTGWAQVHDCYAVPHGIKALQYELFYIQHLSLLLDFHIIFKTIRIVLWIKGK